MKSKIRIIVASDGSGDCLTVQEAVKRVPLNNRDEIEIYLKAGVYWEKLMIDRPFITLLGEGREHTRIVYDDYAQMRLPSGERRGTFRSQTVFIDASDITVRNLTIENCAGYGKERGPALAVYADGDKLIFNNCKIIGSQDTLFTAPLPPEPLVKDGFAGPKENMPRKHGRHYYKDCFISGDVDFIFGSATAYFETCTIFSKENPNEGVKGYVTAASTPAEELFGYVFDRCRFESDCPRETVYLGRPWRDFAKTVLLSCYLGPHIKKKGWHDWQKENARKNLFYAEYNSYGEGANDTRDIYVTMLSAAEGYGKEQVLGSWIREKEETI